MRRRQFIKLVGVAALWPFAAQAQPKPIAKLGVLLYSDPQSDPQMASIRLGLSDLGYVEGRNIAIEYRYAQGRVDRLPSLAAELVQLQPNVILAIGGDVAPIAKRFNQTIPLVFVSSADPEQLGLVANLSRPGGNATGVNVLFTQLAPKLVEAMAELLPQAKTFGLLVNPASPTAGSRAAATRDCSFSIRGSSAFTISPPTAHRSSCSMLDRCITTRPDRCSPMKRSRPKPDLFRPAC